MQGLAHWRTAGQDRGSETSGADRQSEIAAAINVPIAHFWLPGQKSSMIPRARARADIGRSREAIERIMRSQDRRHDRSASHPCIRDKLSPQGVSERSSIMWRTSIPDDLPSSQNSRQ